MRINTHAYKKKKSFKRGGANGLSVLLVEGFLSVFVRSANKK